MFLFYLCLCFAFYLPSTGDLVQLCSDEATDVTLPDTGRQSSLVVGFQPNSSNAVCSRSFFAPEHFGFYLRLYRFVNGGFKSDKRSHRANKPTSFANKGSNASCPLSIVSNSRPFFR